MATTETIAAPPVQYLVELDGTWDDPSEEDMERIRQRFVDAFKGDEPIVAPAGMKIRRLDTDVTHLEMQFERLLYLMQLPPQERAFVQQALELTTDATFWDALADMVEENGRQEAAVRLRRMKESLSITIWKDGTWKLWRDRDAEYAENDPGWMTTLPIDVIADAIERGCKVYPDGLRQDGEVSGTV